MATDDRRIYHVVDGNRGTAIHTVAATVKVGSSLNNNLYTSAKHQALSGLLFPTGLPSGRTGLYTNTANASFLTLVSNLSSDPALLTDRWICYPSDWGPHFTEINPSTDRLRVDGSDEIDLLPTLLHGVRVDRFEAVFSAKWWYAGGNHSHSAFSFIFNATNQDDYDYLLIGLSSANAGAPSGWEVTNGQWRVALPGTSYDANMFTMTSSTTAWFRVTSDGTEVKIYVQDSTTEPTTWNESTDLVHETTSFDMSGGMIGFMGANTDIAIDNLTLKSDRDANGTYETIEHVEPFTLDTNGAVQETLTHDDAGNLTYDGVYQYTYDAWNRLVTITKAYRDDQGTLQTGSTVATLSYDGLGRRITKAIQNSADLDATYHYHYDNQSIVEIRNGSDQVIKHQVWGNLAGQYVDNLVQIAVNGDPIDDPEFDPTDPDHNSQFYYALQNANFNVLGLVDDTGQLVERYEYTPYGKRQVYLSPGTNDPDASAPTSVSRRVTVDGIAMAYGINEVGHHGLSHDEETGLVYNRARMRHPRLARFMQRDPLGYVDGFNLYEYVRGNPTNLVDPNGLITPFITGPNPSTTERVRKAFIATGQFIGGTLFGFGEVQFPGGAEVGRDMRASTFAGTSGRRFGRALGQTAAGVEIGVGGGLIFGGGTVTFTGGGAVVGVPAIVVGTPIVTQGITSAARAARLEPIPFAGNAAGEGARPCPPQRAQGVAPVPKKLKAFPDAQRVKGKTPLQGGGGIRPRWKTKRGNILELDRKKGTVEAYNKTGRTHLGEFDPNTGRQVGPARPGRRIER